MKKHTYQDLHEHDPDLNETRTIRARCDGDNGTAFVVARQGGMLISFYSRGTHVSDFFLKKGDTETFRDCIATMRLHKFDPEDAYTHYGGALDMLMVNVVNGNFDEGDLAQQRAFDEKMYKIIMGGEE